MNQGKVEGRSMPKDTHTNRNISCVSTQSTQNFAIMMTLYEATDQQHYLCDTAKTEHCNTRKLEYIHLVSMENIQVVLLLIVISCFANGVTESTQEKKRAVVAKLG